MSFQRYFLDYMFEDIEVVSMSASRYESDWLSFMHSHNLTELLFVQSGQGYIRALDKSYRLTENDIVITNPFVLHTEYSDSVENSLDYLIIILKNTVFTKSLPPKEKYDLTDEDTDKIIHLKQTSDFNWKKYTSKILQELKNQDKNYLLAVHAHIKLLLTELMRVYNLEISKSATPKNISSKNAIVDYVIKYLSNHYSEKINFAALAEQMYITHSYLVRIFKKETGMTPVEFCLNERIKQAKYLLEYSDLNITQLGLEIGFMSSAYFSKIFHSHTGKTPSEYRASVKQK